MNRRWLGFRSICLAAVLLGSVAATVQHAAAVVSLRISPVLVAISATPGATGSQALTVVNEGDVPVDLTVGIETYQTATGDWSAQDWLAVDQSRVALAPGEDAAITVTLQVPDDVASGGRYALITFTTGPHQSAEPGVAITGKLGAAILIAVEGDGALASDVAIERFGPVLEPDGRIGFRAQLSNDGNLHALPAGRVEVKSVEGDPLGQLDLPMTTPLLPDGEVEMTAQGSLPLPAGERYLARATINVGGGASITAETEFSPEALVAVERTTVCENLDRGPTATLLLRNDGTLGLQPLLQIGVQDAAGSAHGAPVATTAPMLWPGDAGELRVDLPTRLTSGAYTLTVRVDYAAPDAQGRTALPPLEQQTTFAIGGLGPDAAPLCPPSTGA
ncbi:MAG: hypothetical protein ACRDJW_24145 [Thermomicrobiales bacterium]